MASISSNSRLTMTILGCGNMGISILRGVITSQQSGTTTSPFNKEHPSRESAESTPTPPFFTRFIACVNRTESATALQCKVNEWNIPSNTTINIWQGRLLEAVQSADVILLSCQPSQAKTILAGAEMAEALSGKILLSICVGLSLPQLEALIQQSPNSAKPHCALVHAMPNTASKLGESATIISNYVDRPVPTPQVAAITQHIFSSIGKIIHVPADLMPAASVTAASTPAFFALALQGVIQGAMAKGISRQDATIMAAQAMRGAAGMVLDGETPEQVMEKVMTPGGCTERGVRVLQGAGVAGIYADATVSGIERVFEMSRERSAKS